MKGRPMSTEPTVTTLEAMSDEELKAYNKKLGKAVILKIVTGIAASVAVHFASAFVIDKIENKTVKEDQQSITE